MNALVHALTANEGNATVLIFAIVIGVLAVGGIAYFFISNHNKKK